MQIHVLPGDSLVEVFKQTDIKGEIAVCRECLVDGDVSAENPKDFWQVRENYLSLNYPESAIFYKRDVKAEFEKLLNLTEKDEINLWFEHELFCQTNMWFCLWLLRDKNIEFYRVAPIINDEKDIWNGFGVLDANELKKCFNQRVKFSRNDIQLGKQLWKAFCFKDYRSLKFLSKTKSKCFPNLETVCDAAIEQQSRPKETIQKIIANGEKNFSKVFKKFNETEGVYGFGDSQVKNIYNEVVLQNSKM